jgi:hypothetical protein
MQKGPDSGVSGRPLHGIIAALVYNRASLIRV